MDEKNAEETANDWISTQLSGKENNFCASNSPWQFAVMIRRATRPLSTSEAAVELDGHTDLTISSQNINVIVMWQSLSFIFMLCTCRGLPVAVAVVYSLTTFISATSPVMWLAHSANSCVCAPHTRAPTLNWLRAKMEWRQKKAATNQPWQIQKYISAHK